MDTDLLQLIVVVVCAGTTSIVINVAFWYGLPWLWRRARRALSEAESE